MIGKLLWRCFILGIFKLLFKGNKNQKKLIKIEKEFREYHEILKRLENEESEEEKKEALNIYKKIEKDEEQKKEERYHKDYYSNKAKTNKDYIDCEMLMSEHDYLYENYSEIEMAKKNDITELMYQGYIENEDDEYFPEELYYYLNNDYYQYDDMRYDDYE